MINKTFEELSNKSSWFMDKHQASIQETIFPTESWIWSWTPERWGPGWVAEYCPPIPEPSTWGLMLAGLAAIIFIVNNKLRKN